MAILPGGLQQIASSARYREAIAAGRFTAVSPYHPGAKFTAGNAMGRNRLIYVLGDAAVVVETADGSGGTWAGATETLKQGWVPVFVRRGEKQSAGIRSLEQLGARPLTSDVLADSGQFDSWLQRAMELQGGPRTEREGRQLDLFGTGQD